MKAFEKRKLDTNYVFQVTATLQQQPKSFERFVNAWKVHSVNLSCIPVTTSRILDDITSIIRLKQETWSEKAQPSVVCQTELCGVNLQSKAYESSSLTVVSKPSDFKWVLYMYVRILNYSFRVLTVQSWTLVLHFSIKKFQNIRKYSLEIVNKICKYRKQGKFIRVKTNTRPI